jgi:hypothetical protein
VKREKPVAGVAGKCKGCRKVRELNGDVLCEDCTDKLSIALFLEAFGYSVKPL